MGIRLMALISAVAAMLLLGGCGYKAPPYYEKQPTQEGTSVAL